MACSRHTHTVTKRERKNEREREREREREDEDTYINDWMACSPHLHPTQLSEGAFVSRTITPRKGKSAKGTLAVFYQQLHQRLGTQAEQKDTGRLFASVLPAADEVALTVRCAARREGEVVEGLLDGVGRAVGRGREGAAVGVGHVRPNRHARSEPTEGLQEPNSIQIVQQLGRMGGDAVLGRRIGSVHRSTLTFERGPASKVGEQRAGEL